jgi:hypothetical protein
MLADEKGGRDMEIRKYVAEAIGTFWLHPRHGWEVGVARR